MENKSKNPLGKAYAVASVLVFIALMVYLFFTVGRPLVEYMSDPRHFREWVDSKGFGGRIVFIGIVMLQVIVAIIPGEVVEVAAGYTFGVLEGSALCLLGMGLGSAAIFYLVRKTGSRVVSSLFPLDKIAETTLIKDAEKLKSTIFLLFLIPGTPKDIMTYFAPLSPIKMGEFIAVVSLARIPSVVSSALAGSALGEKDYKTALIVYGITAVFSALAYLIYKKKSFPSPKSGNKD